ncbi:MAG: insulinase family protein [Gallionella sp.]|nr:insulinase family protein [Gallionella sp.]MDD4946998.1 insulinase family protein [Gallionella sp.]
MKRLWLLNIPLLLLLLFAALPAIAVPHGKPVTGSFPLLQPDATAAGISSYLLPNGFKIILARYPSAPDVKVELVVKTGSLYEGYGETGMAHLLEHMLFKGAGPRANIKNDLTRLGARWNADTTADRTSFFEIVSSTPESVDEALRIEADRFIRARFTKADLSSEMTVVRNELEQNDSSPGSVMLRALLRESFFWHGYGRPTIGARSDIEDAPFEALQAFHHKHYRPDNAFIVISGNFDLKRALSLTSTLFAKAVNPSGPRIASWTRESPQAATNRSEVFLPAGSTAAMSAWKIPGEYDRQTIALSLASTAICSGDWGSLRQQLVIDQKAANSASCSSFDKPQAGLLVANASGNKTDDVEKLSRNLAENIEAAAVKGISATQLERAKQEENNAFIRLGNAHEAFSRLLSEAEVAGDWRLVFWQHDMVREITLDEANNALRKWIIPTNRSDVLLHDAVNPAAPEIPKITEAGNDRFAEKNWASVAGQSDPLPQNASDLARATQTFPLGTDGKIGLIARKTQGDMAWLILSNDFGNEAALRDKTLACNVASSLMAYGGGGMNRDQLDARLEALRANWDLGLGRISLNAPRNNIAAAFDILLSVWSQPLMPQAEFDRLKAAAIASLEASLKDPAALASSTVELRFDNYPEHHPYKSHSLEQELAEIRALRFEQVKSCQNEFKGLSHANLVLVGEFSPQDVRAFNDKIAQLPTSAIPYSRIAEMPAPEQVDTAPVTVAVGNHPNANLAGMTLLPLTDQADDFPALRIAINILGGNSDSRIWNSLRETGGLAYSAGAQLAGSMYEPRSRLMLSASASSEKAEVALDALKKVLDNALTQGFTDQEVARAKITWTQDRKRYANEERLFAARLSQIMRNDRDFDWIARYDARIAAVTAKDATAALRKYLATANIVWMVGKGNAGNKE